VNMTEKDEFTFDDQDDFPETDLSGAFEEGEQSAPVEPPPEKKKKKMSLGGGGKSRSLLLVLLLVIAIGGGAYYFMGLGETTPEPVSQPAKPQKSVSLPPQPSQPAVKKPAVAPKPQAAAVKLVAPEPPPAKIVAAETKPAPKPAAVAPAPVKPEATAPKPEKAAKAPVPPAPKVVTAAPEVKPMVKTTPPVQKKTQPAAPAKVATAIAKPAGQGPYTLDAGAYLVTSNREALEVKLLALGYKPVVEPVEVDVQLVRLRLGEFPENEVEEALKYVKGYAPDAFSLRKGDQHVVYAGSFLDRGNIDALKQRLTKEGIPVKEEPVEVKRTLSRVRFGSFPNEEKALAAVQEVEKAGIQAMVVKAE
jgi:hypothetical protein